ncbi:MBL fold metallo-hydrolase, partial [Candidatus Aenigmatarchaeota archaeon]
NDSNIYIIDGEIIIDTGTGLFFSEIKERIRKKYDTTKIKKIINTHCHFDHTGGNKKFRDWLRADIHIHIADKQSLETGVDTLSEMFGKRARTTTTDKVLKGGNVFETQNFKFVVISTPGHTPGSICLYDKKSKVMLTGDTVFDNAIGRTDLPGGNEEDITY